jgi:hypothetical protein
MLAADYPMFEKLAAKWREQNPADVLMSRPPKLLQVDDETDELLQDTINMKR